MLSSRHVGAGGIAPLSRSRIIKLAGRGDAGGETIDDQHLVGFNSTAVWLDRAVFRLPVVDQRFVMGSYSSLTAVRALQS
jgi:hypothetical protein